MGYTQVIDPVSGAATYEWEDRDETLSDETRRKTAERQANTEPVDLKAAAIGTAKAVPRMFVNAGIHTVQEGSDLIRDVGGHFGILEGTTNEEHDKPILGLGDWKPEPLESSGMAEDIGTGILQFGLEWVLLTKALRLANWGLKATPLARPLAYAGAKSKQIKGGILKTVGKSPVAPRTLQDLTKFGIKTATATSPKAAIIDFAGFDQYEGRLYDLAANSDTWFNNVKHIPILNQLATNPEDEGLKGRFKNALEGAFIDLGIGSVISARSAAKVIDQRIELAKLQKLVKGTPDYNRQLEKVIAAGPELEKVPEIRTALADGRRTRRLSDAQIEARQDFKVFEKGFMHLPREERLALWRKQRGQRGLIAEKRGVKTVTGDLDSIKRQIEELGPEPPKPGKGKSIVNGKHTPAYKRWNKWNRTNKSLQARLQELETAITPRASAIDPDVLPPEAPKYDTGWTDYYGNDVPPERVAKIEEAQRAAELDPTNESYKPELAQQEAIAVRDPNALPPSPRNAAKQNAKEMADALESGDVPYWWGPGDPAWKPEDVKFWGGDRKRKADENVAAMVMEGRSVGEIIENLKGNKPQRIPGETGFPSLADAKGISLAHYRGVDKIKAKLRSLVGQDFKFTDPLTKEEIVHRYTRDDYEPIYEFIELMGEELFDDVVLSLKQIPAEGRFNFARKLVEINRRTIATGQFSETMVHELWHSLSRYLPAKDLKRYAKEWKTARERYLKDTRKNLLKDKNGKVLNAKQITKLRDGLILRGKDLVEETRIKMKEKLGAEPARSDVLDAFQETAESKRMQKTFDELETHRVAQAELDGFNQGLYTDQNYRFMAVDEYFAEMLKDQFFLHINKKALAPEGSFRRLLQDVGIFFKEIWVQIHAALGGPNTEKVFNDYLKGRNNKKLRKYSMETYFEPGFVAAVKADTMIDALDVLIAGGKREVVERSAFDDILFGDGIKTSLDARIKYTPDELADLSDFIRSFEDPTYEKVLKKLDDYLYPEKGDKAAPYPIDGKEAERIDDLLDILQEEDPRAYKEWDWMRNDPTETAAEQKIRTDAEDEARFQEESRLYDEQQGRTEAGDDPRGFYENEARIYDSEMAGRSEEPAGGRIPREEVEQVGEEITEKIKSGDAELLDTPQLWQDVTTLRSPKGREYYPGSSEAGGDFEQILDSVSRRFEEFWTQVQGPRSLETGMPSISTNRLAQELGTIFREEGINLDAILYNPKLVEATEFLSRNVENITNLLEIRFGLNFAGEETAKWARLADRATDDPSINKAEAITNMLRHLETTLQFSRVYQTWTRAAGGLLQSAQAEILTEGITETTKRTNLNFDKITAISEASKVPAQTVVSNLPDEVLNGIRTGEWTPEAEGFMDQLIFLSRDTNTKHGMKTLQDLLGANQQISSMRNAPKISNYERWGKGTANYYVNNLLSAVDTWGVQLSGLAKAVSTEPLSMGINALAHRDFQNARLMMLQYDYLRRTFYGALKLGAKAFELGQSLYDPKMRTAAWASDLAQETNINKGYARDRAFQLEDPHPSFNLNTSPFTREAKGNPGLNVANVLWRLGTWNIRGQLAIDTFTRSLAGNSLAWVTGVDQGLNKGKRLGLKGIELENYARKYAQGRIEFYTFDAVVNGETIADALMKDEAAVQIGRILTFTDQTRARMPQRHSGYAEEIARQRGITDEKEVAEFVKRYMDGELEGAQKIYNDFMRGNTGKSAKDQKGLPDPGEVTPVMTSAWSQIPMRWGRLQAGQHGFWASFIQPFNRSPGDMTKQWIRMTPLNWTVDTFYRDLFNENVHLRNRWKTELATGTTAAGLFAMTALHDDDFPIEFTGYGPNSPDMRKEWTDQERPPLSWRTRGRDKDGNPSYGEWHSFRGYEPAATFIGGLADYKMLYGDLSGKDRDDLVAGFSMSITAQVISGRFNATYYKGIVDFIDAIGLFRQNLPGRRELEPSERTKLARYVQRFLANFIPESGRMREVSRAMDPYKREISSGVRPKEAFDEADKDLVKMRDHLGRTVYLKKRDTEKGSTSDQMIDWISGFARQQIDEIKNTIPGFSETLPERINWITGLPIRNKGFLGSDQLPLDDAPWLSRLSSAYFRTIPGAASSYGIGARGHEFDPRLDIQKKKGVETYEYKGAIVNDELIKLNRAGDVFAPPRPTDFGDRIKLSPPAFRQYKQYIYTVTLPEYGGKNLTEALYQLIQSKDYQAQEYTAHPMNGTDPLEGIVRSDDIQEIINKYKHAAKERFRNDGSNEYRMEVTLPEHRLKEAEIQQEEIRRSRPLYDQGDNMELNAQDFAASINR